MQTAVSNNKTCVIIEAKETTTVILADESLIENRGWQKSRHESQLSKVTTAQTFKFFLNNWGYVKSVLCPAVGCRHLLRISPNKFLLPE